VALPVIKAFQKNSKFIPLILAEIGLFFGMALCIAWLWDKWLLPGPHGPYRWVGMDFIPFWVGVRGMFLGTTPYSVNVTAQIQQLAYGGAAVNLDPLMFGYPAWIFFIIAPLVLFPLTWAVVILESALLTGLLNIFFISAIQWGQNKFRPTLFWILMLVFGSLPFMVISITRGQLGYLGLFGLLISRRLWERKPFLAGVILSLAIVKPTVTVIPVVGFLIWALMEKNWKYLFGFAAAMTTLVVTSMLLIGNWIPDYLKVLSVSGGLPVMWSYHALSFPWNVLYVVIFIAILIFALVFSLHSRQRSTWLSATVLAGIALFPMHWIYDLFLGILIPLEERNFSCFQKVSVTIAMVASWGLVIIPQPARWDVALIGFPLVWAVVLLSIIYERRKRPLNVIP
jgi:hypothetical protein